MTDSGYPSDAPTRPDLPKFAALKCEHCGKVYGQHAEMFPSDTEAKCLGLRAHFTPKAKDLEDDGR